MPSGSLELPLTVAKAFARDMRPILMNLAVSATIMGESRAVTVSPACHPWSSLFPESM
jgi:hypothetical protein